MQLSFKKHTAATLVPTTSLADLLPGRQAVIVELDLPGELATRLMTLGFVPGNTVALVRTAPGGDPLVFRVDGAELALRRDTAQQIRIDSESISPLEEP